MKIKIKFHGAGLCVSKKIEQLNSLKLEIEADACDIYVRLQDGLKMSKLITLLYLNDVIKEIDSSDPILKEGNEFFDKEKKDKRMNWCRIAKNQQFIKKDQK